jgi:hypothetical protein
MVPPPLAASKPPPPTLPHQAPRTQAAPVLPQPLPPARAQVQQMAPPPPPPPPARGSDLLQRPPPPPAAPVRTMTPSPLPPQQQQQEAQVQAQRQQLYQPVGEQIVNKRNSYEVKAPMNPSPGAVDRSRVTKTGAAGLIQYLVACGDLRRDPNVFRESVPNAQGQLVLQRLAMAQDPAHLVELLSAYSTVVVGHALKVHLREMPFAIVPPPLHPQLARAAANPDRAAAADQMRALLSSMARESWELLRSICLMLREVDKVTPAALAYTFGPLLMRLDTGQLGDPMQLAQLAKHANAVVAVMIDQPGLVFAGDALGTPPPPPRRA